VNFAFCRGYKERQHMKNIFTGIIALLACPLFAGNLFNQLESVNENWLKQSVFAINETETQPRSEIELIRSHLLSVVSLLDRNPPQDISSGQLRARKQNLRVLENYAYAGIFPQNYYHLNRTPVFIDEHGTHCAVGFLMMCSGRDDLARRISGKDNYVFVRDIDDPEISAWQKNSGFTLDELALIQPAYMAPPTVFEQQYACTTVYFQNQFVYSFNPGDTVKQPKAVWYSGECANGVLNGKWQQFHSPGVLWIDGQFVNGKKNGDWFWYSHYSRDGKKVQKHETWKMGVRDGMYTEYDYAGNKITEGFYVDGEKHGEWKFWQSNCLTWREMYHYGDLHGHAYQYYVDWKDSSKHEVCIDALYANNILLERTWFSGGGNGSLTEKKRRSGENRYYTEYYCCGDSVQMAGMEIFTIRVDSSGDMMYPNLPVKYMQHDVFLKTGRWTMFPPRQSQFVTGVYDSAHVYFENDSVRSTVRFYSRNGETEYDSTIFLQLRSFTPQYYGERYPASKRFFYRNGSWFSYSEQIGGNTIASFVYQDGKLLSGRRMDSLGYYELETWKPVGDKTGLLKYEKHDEKRRLLISGTCTDMNRWTGEWIYYDTIGRITAKGSYEEGLKEGYWIEQDPDTGAMWEGAYKAGTKTGTWKLVSHKGEIIRREKF
jgi:antitoxin component YwqK of YwqJK toxin-antitoxin module